MKAFQNGYSAALVCGLSLFLSCSASLRAEAYTTIEAKIPVNCASFSDQNDYIYDIKIESETNESPVPHSDILNIAEDCTGFFEIDITEPGTYRYKIYETASDYTDIRYDSNVYEITVYVINTEEDALAYSVIAAVNGKVNKSDRIAFQNIFVPDNKISITTAAAETTVTADFTAASSQTTAETVTGTVTAATTAPAASNQITHMIGNVLTGDSFPAQTFRLVMLFSILIAISTVFLKRNSSKGEDQNEK